MTVVRRVVVSYLADTTAAKPLNLRLAQSESTMAKNKTTALEKKQTQTAPAAPVGAGATVGAGFVVKKLVTLPLWKWQDGVAKFFKITSPIVLGKAVDDKRAKKDEGDESAPAGVKMAPAHICNVVNLETAEVCQIIVGSVLKGNLEESYPNASYVGKCFMSTQSKIEGKRYKGYSLAEIEEPKPAKA